MAVVAGAFVFERSPIGFVLLPFATSLCNGVESEQTWIDIAVTATSNERVVGGGGPVEQRAADVPENGCDATH